MSQGPHRLQPQQTSPPPMPQASCFVSQDTPIRACILFVVCRLQTARDFRLPPKLFAAELPGSPVNTYQVRVARA